MWFISVVEKLYNNVRTVKVKRRIFRERIREKREKKKRIFRERL